MHYSIHTLEFYARLSPLEFEDFFKLIAKRSKCKSIAKSNKLFYTFWNFPKGISRIFAIKVYKEDGKTCLCVHLHIHLNPLEALPPDLDEEGTLLPNPDDIQVALWISFERLKSLLPCNVMERLILNRVDYTGDLRFPDQRQADEYILLLRKGRTVWHLQERAVFDPRAQCKVIYSDSWLLECKSYDFQVYPKYSQMIQRKIAGADKAKGVVRFELRASGSKIKLLSRKYEEGNLNDFFETIPHMARIIPEPEIKRIVAPSVGSGDFHTLSETRRKIAESKYQAKVKATMIRTSELLVHHANVNDIISQNLITREEWRNTLSRFNLIGCSPIPIPVRNKFHEAPGIISWHCY